MRLRFWVSAFFSLLALPCSQAVWAEAPYIVAQPAEARAKIVGKAQSYLGLPYRYGGKDEAGFDCSGLVYRVFLDTLGYTLPRTVRKLYSVCEPIERKKLEPGDLVFFDTMGGLSHVGIYSGQNKFLHSASAGPRTGVIESDLSEDYWAKTYAGSGRLLTPVEYAGVTVSLACGPGFGFAAAGPVRSFWLAAGVSYRVIGWLSLGLELRPEYDWSLGMGLVPVVFSLEFGGQLSFFLGPALVLGSPLYDAEGAARSYVTGTRIMVGLAWTPYSFHIGGFSLGLCGELVYTNLAAEAGFSEDWKADLAASFRIGLGLKLRYGF